MNKRVTLGIAVLLALTFSATAVAQDNDEPRWEPVEQPEPAEQPAPDEAAPAETDAPEEPRPTPEEEVPDPGLGRWFLPAMLIGVLVLMYVWMGRNRKKQEQKRKDMLSQLKKGDRIMSIGGILGTVIEAKPDELVVKVDETNNVRMRFARWAVRAVGDEAESDASKDQPQN